VSVNTVHTTYTHSTAQHSKHTHSMSVDAAFSGAGKEAGLTLWRIENKMVVKQKEVH
jgi:hypothetical protein